MTTAGSRAKTVARHSPSDGKAIRTTEPTVVSESTPSAAPTPPRTPIPQASPKQTIATAPLAIAGRRVLSRSGHGQDHDGLGGEPPGCPEGIGRP